MPRLIHPDEGMVYACPYCGTAGDVYRRTRQDNTEVGGDAEFVCHRCDEGRDGIPEAAIVEREAKEGGASGVARPRSETARALLEADPDAVGGGPA